jgi:hypothetical protein
MDFSSVTPSRMWVRGDYEVSMFGQAGGQVKAIIVRKNIFL